MKNHTLTIWALATGLLLASAGPEAISMVETPVPAGRKDTPAPLGSSAQDRDTLTRILDCDGVRVIYRFLPGAEVVAINLYLLGGARQISERTAGIEPLLLRASEHGTRSYPDLAARRALARTGSWTFVSPEADWTVFGVRGLAEAFDSTWTVFADRVMHPTLDTAGVETERAKMVGSAMARQAVPDEIIVALAEANALRGHPYEFDVRGTVSSLGEIEIADLEAYLTEQMVTSRMLLVVVGNVSEERLRTAIGETLGQLPPGEYVWEMPPSWTASDPTVTVAYRELPTKYILGYFAGPPATSDEIPAFRVAVAALSSLISSRAREEGLTYVGRAYFLNRGASGGAIYFSTDFAEDCVKLTNDFIYNLRNAAVRRRTLRGYGRGSTTGYYVQNETSGEQAAFLARSFLYRGVLPSPEAQVEELLDIPSANVRNAARRYFKNIQYVFLGDTTNVPRKEMTKW